MFHNPWRLLSAAALAFSVLAVSVACGGAAGSSSNSTSGTSSSSLVPSSGAGNEEQVVSRAIQVQNRLRDLTLTTQSDTTQGGRSFTSQSKVQWTASPERFYARTSSSLSNRETEVILDTPTQATYVKSGANWIRTPAGGGGGSLGSGFMPSLKGDAFQGFKVVGQETVERKPAWHLSGPMPFTPGSSTATSVPNTTGTLDVWVGRGDYQLVKQVEVLKSSDNGGFSLKATAVVDSVNTGVTIELPVTQ